VKNGQSAGSAPTRGADPVSQVRMCVECGVPALVWGPPGVGKTAAITAMAQQMGRHLEVVIGSVREPADFLGLPVVGGGDVRYAPPAWARRLAEAERGLLFLDEISTAPPAVQAALLRVVLERVVGELELPPSVAIVAAANPPDMAADGWDLSAPLANRFAHIEWAVDAQSWCREFPGYWGCPPDVRGLPEPAWARARGLVAGFLHARPGLLLQVPESAAERGRAWPSPRTWDMASRLMAALMSRGSSDLAEAALLAVPPVVGEGAGLEFAAWVREQDLPDPEAVLARPDDHPLPERGDALYAVLCSVAAVAQDAEERWLRAWRVMGRVASGGGADVAAAAARMLAAARRDGWATPREAAKFVPLLRAAGALG
jgi:hypothetical protein